jgi:predicted RNA binding protein YcfA (HicA-like mRNA interferase family)
MARGYYASIVAELKARGFRFIRTAKGSHEIWANDAGRQTTVPRNLKIRHTANAILKGCGSDKKL